MFARDAADRRRALLGDGARPGALYRLGPGGPFVGRPAADLPRSKRAPCEARLHQALSAPTPYSKAYLSGSVTCPDGPAGHRPVLAVVKGAVVAAGVLGAQQGGAAPLRLVLPEESVEADVTPELFLGTADGTRLGFAPLKIASGAWRLEFGRLVSADGLTRRLGAPAAKALKAPKPLKDVLEVRGEARMGDGAPAEAVVVFSGSEFVFAGAPDPVSAHFDFALPRDLAGELRRLRVFGVRGAEAWEILQ